MTRMKFKVVVNGKEYVVEVEEIAGVPVATSIMRGSSEITVDEKPKEAVTETPKVVERVKAVSKEEVAAVQPPAEGIGEIVRAPLPGKITRVLVSEGQEVKSGQTVLYIEAMKMENEVVAPKDGRITKLYVKPGDSVNTDDPLFAVS